MKTIEQINMENKKKEKEIEKRTKKENKSYHAALTLMCTTILISFTNYISGISNFASNLIMQVGALSVIAPSIYSCYQIDKIKKAKNTIEMNNNKIEELKNVEQQEKTKIDDKKFNDKNAVNVKTKGNNIIDYLSNDYNIQEYEENKDIESKSRVKILTKKRRKS